MGFKKRPQSQLVKEGPLKQCDSCGRGSESYYLDQDVVVCEDCFKASRAEEADREYSKEKARIHSERSERKNWRSR